MREGGMHPIYILITRVGVRAGECQEHQLRLEQSKQEGGGRIRTSQRDILRLVQEFTLDFLPQGNGHTELSLTLIKVNWILDSWITPSVA